MEGSVDSAELSRYYAGEYGEYCNACQAAVVRSSDALEVLPGVANSE